jgi:protein arginine kinase activator
MKCDVCEAEATVFLTQIINGQMTTVNLCEACAKAKGVTEETGFGLAEAFISNKQAHTTALSEDLACPDCGFTAAQLKKIGRMGCPECYETFREGLDGILRGMHKGIRHTGKRPGSMPAPLPASPRPRRSVSPAAVAAASAPPPAPAPTSAVKEEPSPPVKTASDLTQLRAALDLAVKEERYEDAAVIKTQIEQQQKATAK